MLNSPGGGGLAAQRAAPGRRPAAVRRGAGQRGAVREDNAARADSAARAVQAGRGDAVAEVTAGARGRGCRPHGRAGASRAGIAAERGALLPRPRGRRPRLRRAAAPLLSTSARRRAQCLRLAAAPRLARQCRRLWSLLCCRMLSGRKAAPRRPAVRLRRCRRVRCSRRCASRRAAACLRCYRRCWLAPSCKAQTQPRLGLTLRRRRLASAVPTSCAARRCLRCAAPPPPRRLRRADEVRCAAAPLSGAPPLTRPRRSAGRARRGPGGAACAGDHRAHARQRGNCPRRGTRP